MGKKREKRERKRAVQAAAIPLPSFSPALPSGGGSGQQGFKRPSQAAWLGSPPVGSWSTAKATLALYGLEHVVDPRLVPWTIIDIMGYHPAVYLGEQTVAAPVRDPSLYVIDHPDPAIVAETKAWLDPLLPVMLLAASRALAYGVAPMVFNWGVEDLITQVPKDEQSRQRTFPNHQHYVSVHEIHPSETTIHAENDALESLTYMGDRYAADRAAVCVWDKAWGSWRGHGSRHRAFPAWTKSQHVSRWEGRYLERSVDAPRVIHVPRGTIEIDGVEVPTTEYAAEAFAFLKGSGVIVLPSDTDPNSKTPAWSVDTLQVPLVQEVWTAVLDYCDAQCILSSGAPPSVIAAIKGGGDLRSIEAIFQEYVEGIADVLADFIEQRVAIVHAIRYGKRVKAPQVYARDLPKAKIQRLLEVFKVAALVEREAGGGKKITLAERIDDSFLEELGLQRRPLSEAAREPAAPPSDQPGRPLDTTSGKQERRDSSRTPEGSDSTA